VRDRIERGLTDGFRGRAARRILMRLSTLDLATRLKGERARALLIPLFRAAAREANKPT
jgi:hypothetical protein